MTGRRFTDKASLDPSAVVPLSATHPAMIGNRTLFPSTVVKVDENFTGRLLISGRENRKLGDTISKGKFKGYSLHQLSLEERATCPTSCDARAFCYGNAMHLAKRHRIDNLDHFEAALEAELSLLLVENPTGLMVRLHVLGDFPSVEYVAMWADLLLDNPRLACFGYTHRTRDDDIGLAIDGLKSQYADRFRIRWSSAHPKVDGATIIDWTPPQDRARIEEGALCQAQRSATACCASCTLCWESSRDTIVFIKHGMKSMEHAATVANAARDLSPAIAAIAPPPPAPSADLRPVAALPMPISVKSTDPGEPPVIRLVPPSELRVEPRYQRDLSGRSIALIRKIVAGWDWAKFKPPVCAETAGGLMVIDGQHTAIAAASHPKILRIPVVIVEVPKLEERAAAFVAHNRDRLTMTAAQLLYAEAAASGKDAVAIFEIAARVNATIPRTPSTKGRAKPGEIVAISQVRQTLRGCGPEKLERILKVAVLARCAPITTTAILGLRMIFTEAYFAQTAALGDSRIAAALSSIRDLEKTAQHHAGLTGQNRYRAAACLIRDAAVQKVAA